MLCSIDNGLIDPNLLYYCNKMCLLSTSFFFYVEYKNGTLTNYRPRKVAQNNVQNTLWKESIANCKKNEKKHWLVHSLVFTFLIKCDTDSQIRLSMQCFFLMESHYLCQFLILLRVVNGLMILALFFSVCCFLFISINTSFYLTWTVTI